MDIDFDLYRHEIRISSDPLVRLSAIDVSPELPKRTLIFIHGFGGKAEQWQYQMQKFALDNRVIALDLRGHGLSDKPTSGYDMPRIQLDLETALTQLKVSTPFVLIGHSFGGAVVTEYALNHPDHVEKLIIIATAGEFKLKPLFKLALNLPASVLRLVGLFTRRWLHAPPHALRPFYLENLSQWVGWDRFKKLQVPTMVIRGHRDLVFDRPLFEKVAGSIPDGEDVDIGVSGHMVMLERREAVDRAIARFLKGETKKSWRDDSSLIVSKSARDELKSQRVWLNHYENGVPYTVDVPRIPAHHLLRSSVRRFPNHTAIFFEGAKLTYRKLNHEANRFANALLAQGIGKGARVVLLLPNVPQMVIGFYGALKAGAAVVLIPPMIEPEELTRQVKESDASVLVTLSIWSGLAKQIQRDAGTPHLVLTDPAEYLPLPKYLISRWRNRGLDVQNALHWNRWLSAQSDKSPAVDVQPGDLAAIIFTGGTTAQSKGVMLSHRNLVANALQTRHWLPDAEEGRERFLCVVPFFHSYGMTAALNVPVSLGAALILKAQFQTLEVLKTIKKYKPTIFPGTPSMYVAITNFRGVRKYGINSIKACISGSAPLHVEVQESFEKLTKGKLVEGYGLSEASPITHANPLGKNRKVGSIGVPLPSTHAAVVDLKLGRKEVEPGQIGELAVRGPQVMMGYWKNEAATREVLTDDGWLLTGDVAQMDEEGYFRIIARKADMWYPEKPGAPAFPRDVEEVIYEIPQVKETVVVAVAGHPFAFVIAGKEKPSAESVIAYCKRRLPPHLVPRFVIFMDDFPRTFIGKVLRRELAKRYGKQIAGE
ncbi:MAG: alpha/beta fold hydrolase [Anaerolineales bacterium]|uniref:alpha/beta fold hydrolase n=1 Tax=Candidatus Villigracilis affinis TaxID=3140682 RepID=UPI002A1C7BC4|nr:alpha/beta fold hydrolase [Anaerolineales bacterium]MBL0346622.1 alpha/beta fold hydrolase [Anaerolineales bacterium]